jgi:regulator of protease activity HflC (stomatin/prohibitin superfamily)
MVLIIIAIVLAAITCPTIYYALKEANKKSRYQIRIGLKPLFGLLWLLIIVFGMFTTISKNSVGIVYDELHNGIQDGTLGEGLHIKSPFQKIYTVETTNKIQSITVAGQTSDSIYADFMITIVYRIEKDNAGKFFRKTNAGDIDAGHLNSIARETLQAVSTQYDIYSILGKDLDKVRQEFTEKLTEKMLDRYYITIISTSFDDVDAGERIEETIRTKGEAQQQIEIEKLNQEKAETQAEILRIEAQAKADAVRIAAQAEADKIEFEKQAIANMITEYIQAFPTLTEKEVATIILQTIFYETWDGKLPDVVTGDALEALLGSLVSRAD